MSILSCVNYVKNALFGSYGKSASDIILSIEYEKIKYERAALAISRRCSHIERLMLESYMRRNNLLDEIDSMAPARNIASGLESDYATSRKTRILTFAAKEEEAMQIYMKKLNYYEALLLSYSNAVRFLSEKMHDLKNSSILYPALSMDKTNSISAETDAFCRDIRIKESNIAYELNNLISKEGKKEYDVIDSSLNLLELADPASPRSKSFDKSGYSDYLQKKVGI